MSSPQITDETFTEFVSRNTFAVVHCWAAWNSHDHTMRARIAEVKPEFPDIAFAEFDVDPPSHRDICKSLNVHGPPFVALYRHGSLFETRVGLLEREDLRLFLNRLLQSTATSLRE